MAIMAMAIVFSGLLLLYLMFRLIGQITVFVKKRNAMRVHGISDKEEAKEKGLVVNRAKCMPLLLWLYINISKYTMWKILY